MKKCINGIMREMNADEIKEQNEVKPISEDKETRTLEERLQKLEKLLERLGLNK